MSAFYLHNLRRRAALSLSLSSVFNAPAGWLAGRDRMKETRDYALTGVNHLSVLP